MFTGEFQKGEDYSALKDCIHIGILGFNLGQTEHLYSVIKLVDMTNHEVYSSKLSLRVLYLKKLKYQYLMREKAANDAVTLRNYYTNEGLEKGLKKGLEKGALIKLISLIRRKQQKGIPAEQTAGMLEEDVDLVQTVYRYIIRYSDYTDEEICKLL